MSESSTFSRSLSLALGGYPYNRQTIPAILMGDKADLEDESSTDIQVDLISAFLNLDLTARSAPFGFQPTDPNPLNLFLPLIARVASARSLLKNVRGDGASERMGIRNSRPRAKPKPLASWYKMRRTYEDDWNHRRQLAHPMSGPCAAIVELIEMVQ